jgi:hypothetical protein
VAGQGSKGAALGVVAIGTLLLWSGLSGKKVTVALRDLIAGKSPTLAPSSNAISNTAYGYGSAASLGTTVAGGTNVVGADKAYQALRQAGASPQLALILTAVGGAESGWNAAAVNNDPATGDYSIGVWQINYYGNLLQSRTAEFGPPDQLVGNLAAQAHAAVVIAHGGGGLSNWTTYTRGTYSAYLLQAQQAAQSLI